MPNQTPATGAPSPALAASTKDGQWTLDPSKAETFTLIVFYRGYHCPICKQQLEQLNKDIGKFADKGVEVVAISMDSEDRFGKTADEWDISDVTVAYDLDEQTARDWGLYISTAISNKEPDRFSEPGLFLIKPDGVLFAASIQSMPFARPQLNDILGAVDFILNKDYPPRGVAT